MRYVLAAAAAMAAVLIAIVTPTKAETWATGCRNIKQGTISQIKEGSSKPLRPCKAGEVQTTILIEVPGVKFGRREALLTELGSKVVLERRAVTVTLEWLQHPEFAICQFFFTSRGRKTSLSGVITNEDGVAFLEDSIYVDDGQVVLLYDIVTTFDGTGCHGSTRFRQANARKNDVGSRAAIRALFSK